MVIFLLGLFLGIIVTSLILYFYFKKQLKKISSVDFSKIDLDFFTEDNKNYYDNESEVDDLF